MARGHTWEVGKPIYNWRADVGSFKLYPSLTELLWERRKSILQKNGLKEFHVRDSRASKNPPASWLSRTPIEFIDLRVVAGGTQLIKCSKRWENEFSCCSCFGENRGQRFIKWTAVRIVAGKHLWEENGLHFSKVKKAGCRAVIVKIIGEQLNCQIQLPFIQNQLRSALLLFDSNGN